MGALQPLGGVNYSVDTMSKTSVALCVVTALAAGCATPIALTREGQRVKVLTVTRATANCRFVGEVQGKADGEDLAEVALRNHAAAQDADTVVLANRTSWGTAVVLVGKAYVCKSRS